MNDIQKIMYRQNQEKKEEINLANIISYFESYLDSFTSDDIQKAVDCTYFSKAKFMLWKKSINCLKLCQEGLFSFLDVELYFEEEEKITDLMDIFDLLRSAIDNIFEFVEGHEIISVSNSPYFNRVIFSGLCCCLEKASKYSSVFFYGSL